MGTQLRFVLLSGIVIDKVVLENFVNNGLSTLIRRFLYSGNLLKSNSL